MLVLRSDWQAALPLLTQLGNGLALISCLDTMLGANSDAGNMQLAPLLGITLSTDGHMQRMVSNAVAVAHCGIFIHRCVCRQLCAGHNNQNMLSMLCALMLLMRIILADDRMHGKHCRGTCPTLACSCIVLVQWFYAYLCIVIKYFCDMLLLHAEAARVPSLGRDSF